MATRWLALGALGFVATVWAGGYIAAAVAVAPEGGFGPLWLTSLRLLLAGPVLLGLGWALGARLPAPRMLASVMASGALGWIGGSGMQTIGQQTVPAGTTALILGASPVVALTLSSLVERQRPTAREVAAILAGVAGLAIVVGPTTLGPGVGFVAVATLSWSIAVVWEARRGPAGGHPLTVAGAQMVAGGAGLALMALAAREPWPTPSAPAWAGFFWLAIACAGAGLPVWLWVLRVLPVSVAMTQATLTPVIATGLGALMLGEALGPGTLIGGALVLGAAWVVATSPARPRGEAALVSPAAAPDAPRATRSPGTPSRTPAA